MPTTLQRQPRMATRRPVDLLIGRGLLSAEAIAAELRARLVRELARRRSRYTDQELVELARRILSQFEPILAANLAQSDISAWIAGIQAVSGRLPPWTRQTLLEARESERAIVGPGMPLGGAGRASGPPAGPGMGFEGADEAEIRFPLLERAADSLAERGVLFRPQFDKLSAQEKLNAFTVAYQDSTETLEHIRGALREAIDQGPSLRVFRDLVEERLGASPIGPAHLETVYRTNIQAAFHNGHETLAQDPIVAQLFPYQEYLPIHDARVRPDHLAMETLGLDGTNVYRRDDPVWNRWTPPNGYNCRCGVNLLTLRAAAERGVREAKEWLSTGQPPAYPEWRDSYVPENPAPGFGARPRGVAA